MDNSPGGAGNGQEIPERTAAIDITSRNGGQNGGQNGTVDLSNLDESPPESISFLQHESPTGRRVYAIADMSMQSYRDAKQKQEPGDVVALKRCNANAAIEPAKSRKELAEQLSDEIRQVQEANELRLSEIENSLESNLSRLVGDFFRENNLTQVFEEFASQTTQDLKEVQKEVAQNAEDMNELRLDVHALARETRLSVKGLEWAMLHKNSKAYQAVMCRMTLDSLREAFAYGMAMWKMCVLTPLKNNEDEAQLKIEPTRHKHEQNKGKQDERGPKPRKDKESRVEVVGPGSPPPSIVLDASKTDSRHTSDELAGLASKAEFFQIDLGWPQWWPDFWDKIADGQPCMWKYAVRNHASGPEREASITYSRIRLATHTETIANMTSFVGSVRDDAAGLAERLSKSTPLPPTSDTTTSVSGDSRGFHTWRRVSMWSSPDTVSTVSARGVSNSRGSMAAPPNPPDRLKALIASKLHQAATVLRSLTIFKDPVLMTYLVVADKPLRDFGNEAAHGAAYLTMDKETDLRWLCALDSTRGLNIPFADKYHNELMKAHTILKKDYLRVDKYGTGQYTPPSLLPAPGDPTGSPTGGPSPPSEPSAQPPTPSVPPMQGLAAPSLASTSSEVPSRERSHRRGAFGTTSFVKTTLNRMGVPMKKK